MPKRLTDEQVIEKAQDDRKILTALDDAVRAIFIWGPEKVSMDNLKSVITQRLTHWCEHEVEAEGLDGDAA